MKLRHPLAAAAIATAAAALLPTTPLNAQPAPDKDLVINPNFEIVASRLDRNGDYFTYTDLTKLVQGLQLFATNLQAQLGTQSELKDIPGKIAKTAETIGLDQLAAFGMSTATRKDGRGQTKSYLKFTKPTGLFAQDAETRKPLRIASYGPPTAAILGATRWNPQNLYEKALEVIAIWAPTEEREKISAQIKELKTLGVDIEKAIASLGREFLFAILLDPDEQKTVPVPLPGLKLQIPKPGFILLFETKDDSLRQLIELAAKEAKAPEFEKGEKVLAGWDVIRPPVPDKASEWISPIIGITDGLIAFSLVEADLARAIQSHKDKKDFRTTKDFQKIGAGLPTQYQAITYISPLFPATIRTILDKVIATGAVPREAKAAIQQATRQFGNFDGFVGIQIWDEQGVQDLGRIANPFVPGTASILPAPNAGVAAGAAGVMAAIAVPNFLEAQTRAKVSRAKSDMRSLATAIESYNIDFNAYPPSTTEPKLMFGKKPATAENYSTFKMPSPKQAMPLTTPIGYLTAIFPEPFAANNQDSQWGYHANKDFWVLWSPGPDKKFDLDPQNFEDKSPTWKAGQFQLTEELANQTYDPTNGTISPGDIWRTKQ